MVISPITPPRQPTPAERARGKKTSDFTPHTPAPAGPADPVGAAGAAKPAAPAAPIASVDAVLALQSAGDGPASVPETLARSAGVLDALDAVQLALLGGGDPRSALARLSETTGAARRASGDETLDDLAQAVDVRAAVELAKYETASRPVSAPLVERPAAPQFNTQDGSTINRTAHTAAGPGERI